MFNTEGLKASVKRLNQLGYFKSLEGGEAIDVQKTPAATPGTETSEVDVTLKLEEQNRNQLTFGAGVSQFEGFFGQLSFQTSNFLGRGETLTVAAQAGSRARNYQLAFTEPFLFDRPITLGFDIFTREVRYISQFTQASTGGNLVFGFPLADFTRMFLSYSYEQVKVKELNELYLDPILAASEPLPGGLAAPRRRRPADHQQDRSEPRPQHRRQPDLPDDRSTLHRVVRPRGVGRQHAAADDPGGPGSRRLLQVLQPAARGDLVLPVTPNRTSLGFRGAVGVHLAVRRFEHPSDLRAAVPRRRVQRPRIRHPDDRTVRRGLGPRDRRQQEPVVQRGVPDLHRRARCGSCCSTTPGRCRIAATGSRWTT